MRSVLQRYVSWSLLIRICNRKLKVRLKCTIDWEEVVVKACRNVLFQRSKTVFQPTSADSQRKGVVQAELFFFFTTVNLRKYFLYRQNFEWVKTKIMLFRMKTCSFNWKRTVAVAFSILFLMRNHKINLFGLFRLLWIKRRYLKELCHASLAVFKKFLAFNWIPKITVSVCYLRQYYDVYFGATDGKDGNGLKFEKIRPNFSSFDANQTKSTKRLIMGCAFLKHFIRIFTSQFIRNILCISNTTK